MGGRFLRNCGVTRSRPRDLGAYGFVYVDSGAGYFEAAGRAAQPVRSGDLLLLFPGQRHSYGNPEHGWQEVFAVVNSPHLELWERAGVINRRELVWHLEPVSYWRDGLLRILNRINNWHGSDSLSPLTALLAWLAEARDIHCRRGNTVTPGNQWADHACKQLASVPPGPVDWHAVARACGTSTEVFRKRFRALSGKSPALYRAELLMMEAVRLLSSTDLSVKEIAYQLGYCDPFHFSKRFKHYSGLSPSGFRGLYFPHRHEETMKGEL